MTKLHAALLATALGLTAASCKKETEITGVNITATNFSNLADALDKAQVQAQTYNVNAALGLQFRGPNGSRFVFPPNAFITPTGQAVSGTVQVAVREILRPSDAIFSRIIPATGGLPLLSGGAVWAFATQTGRTVLLRDGAPYTVHMPQRFGAFAVPGLQYYVGDAVDSSGSLSVVDFIADAGGSVGAVADTASITTDTFGYVASGAPIAFLDTDTFNVALTGLTLSGPQAAVYAIPRAANAVYTIQPFTGVRKDGLIFGETEWHFIAMTVQNGRFYAGVTTVPDTKTGDTYTVSLTEMTPGDLKNKIDALP